jgi:hypothetical protein
MRVMRPCRQCGVRYAVLQGPGEKFTCHSCQGKRRDARVSAGEVLQVTGEVRGPLAGDNHQCQLPDVSADKWICPECHVQWCGSGDVLGIVWIST